MKRFGEPSIHWRKNWEELSTFFKYPPEIRKLIYTTNIIEGYHRQLRKVTQGKSIFPSDEALLKMLYLSTMDVVRKWTGRVQNWGDRCFSNCPSSFQIGSGNI